LKGERVLAKLKWDYSKLKGRMIEKFGSQRGFAEKLGISEVYLSQKMVGKIGLTLDDIENWSNELDIPSSEIGVYFFSKRVQ
jgi:transcriptional regulator with XRE-family HTH domain